MCDVVGLLSGFALDAAFHKDVLWDVCPRLLTATFPLRFVCRLRLHCRCVFVSLNAFRPRCLTATSNGFQRDMQLGKLETERRVAC